MTYVIQHHHTDTVLNPFPWPGEDRINAYENEITEMSQILWGHMGERFAEKTL